MTPAPHAAAEPTGEAAATGGGNLLRNMVLFARLLRVGGLDTTPQQLGDWIAALDLVDLRRKQDVKNASRAILVRRAQDLEWFDTAFELFWQARDPDELRRLEMGLMLQKRVERRRRAALEGVAPERSDGGEHPRGGEPERVAAWSAREALRRKDFAHLSGDELAEVERLIDKLRFPIDPRRTRRRVPARHGRALDLRRTLRRSLRHGGELLRIERRDRKLHRRPLVVLCDISGSMEPYSRLLLRFLYAVARSPLARDRAGATAPARVEAFVFGTRLTRVTPQLARRDVDQALRLAAAEIADWGGGTRTGEALKEFNYAWSRRVLGGGAVALVISDGWDRGDPALLSREIERLHRSCHRLWWLNPLLGSPGYQPLTRGMQAALPHLDAFLPVHDLRSLEQLGERLASLVSSR
ncbi:MAG TPA: VWA domain-containing protein [Thermoanaerobaculia bacterium]|nr:VWA domain-containing protein [Thermoanaerobaculia bacterium]